jgi:hypothetical protein
MNLLGLPGNRPSLFPWRFPGRRSRRGNSTMADRTSQGAAPSLVEVLKPLAREWRELEEQAQAIRRQDPDASLALSNQHWEHPIWDLFRILTEHTGIGRETLEAVAWRMNSQNGLAPLQRTPPPPIPPQPGQDGPEWESLPDDEPASNRDLPDLQWVYKRLNECDVNGTTARLLSRFEAMHPGALARLIGDAGRTIDGGRPASRLPVILRGRTEKPLVRGKEMPTLTVAQYNVVKALLDAEDGLKKDRLVEKSGHTDALGILRRIRESGTAWKKVIRFPGKPGGRYRIA